MDGKNESHTLGTHNVIAAWHALLGQHQLCKPRAVQRPKPLSAFYCRAAPTANGGAHDDDAGLFCLRLGLTDTTP